MNKAALFLILLISLSFAGELWKIDTGSAVMEKPLEYGQRVIIGTSAGKIYAVEPPLIKWSYNLGSPIVSEPASFGDKILVATGTKLTALNQYGAFMWETPLSTISGISASDMVYASDSNGLQGVNANGSILWTFAPGSEDAASFRPPEGGYVLTRPLATSAGAFFGYEDYLYFVRNNGSIIWKKQIGHMWNTPPLLSGNTIYAGTSEGIVYSLDSLTGQENYRLNVYGQVSTTPVLFGNYIIVGTSDGVLYGLSQDGIKWSLNVDGKVGREMRLADVGGTPILYLSTSRSVYAVEPTRGTLLFKREFLDMAAPPAYLNNQLIVGTAEGTLYGIDSSKACSITSVEQDSQIGNYILPLKGISYSRAGEPATSIRVNQGAWETLNGTEWEYRLDASKYPFGVMEVECMVSGAEGIESEPYTKLTLVHVESFNPQPLIITYPSSVKADSEFEILVSDQYGVPIQGVSVQAGGKTFRGDGNVTVSLPAGMQDVSVERPGYNTETISIDSKGDPTLAYITGILFVIGFALYIYFFFIKKEKKELIIKEQH